MLSLRPSRFGVIKCVVGPVSSGKTSVLEQLLNSADATFWKDCREAIVLAKNPHDDAQTPGMIGRFSALSTENPDDIADSISPETESIFISGINFFDNPDIVDLLQAIVMSNRRAYVSGLNLDWNAQPFNFMPEIMALSDEIEIRDTPCKVPGCELSATRSLRVGEGGERRCIQHHFFEGRPDHKPFLIRQTGSLEMFVGNMFASKTTLWYARMNDLSDNGVPFDVFKWIGDQRYSERGKNYEPFQEGVIGFNSGNVRIPAVLIRDAKDLSDYLDGKTGIREIDERSRARMVGNVFIDEGQFLRGISSEVQKRMHQGYAFYITGLMRNYKMEPFNREMGCLLTFATRINVLNGNCVGVGCRLLGSESQRLKKSDSGLWLPADYNDPLVLVGGNEGEAVEQRYESRCRDCTKVPGTPTRKYEFSRFEPN